MSSGFVSCVNDAYLPLAELLKESVYRFSTKQLCLLHNSDWDHTEVCKEKLRLLINPPFEETVFLDADTVVGPNIDKIWDMVDWTLPHPLAQPHNNSLSIPLTREWAVIGRIMPTTPYLHTCIMAFGMGAAEFGLAALDLWTKVGVPTVMEESLVNNVTWAMGFTETLPYMLIAPACADTIGAKQIKYGVHGIKDISRAKKLLESMQDD